jgi:hypothetical protein
MRAAPALRGLYIRSKTQAVNSQAQATQPCEIRYAEAANFILTRLYIVSCGFYFRVCVCFIMFFYILCTTFYLYALERPRCCCLLCTTPCCATPHATHAQYTHNTNF